MTSPLPTISGMTLQIYVPAEALEPARRFYAKLLGAEPALQTHDDFLEWQLVEGQGTWVQVVALDERPPLRNRVRFRVDDIHNAKAAMEERGLEIGEIKQLPGAVAFCNFSDPWGNRLGYVQDLVAQTAEAATYPGTSVNDQSLIEYPERKHRVEKEVAERR